MSEERRIVTIDEKIYKNKEHILRFIADELEFPDYFGLNYDALSDCLGDIFEPTTLRFVEEEDGARPECVQTVWQIANTVAEWNPDLTVETAKAGEPDAKAGEPDAKAGEDAEPEAKAEDDGVLSAAEALQRLERGNRDYLQSGIGMGDVSMELRRETAENGQKPYAIIITCSDSRVIPEYIFSAGIGELFVIRVAGNVLDNHQLGSIEYAAEHLGTKLIVMLGHTRCGAVASTIAGHSGGFIDYILKDINEAIGSEKDDYKASCLNIRHGVQRIRHEFQIHPIEDDRQIEVIGAIYHVEDGSVEFLKDE